MLLIRQVTPHNQYLSVATAPTLALGSSTIQRQGNTLKPLLCLSRLTKPIRNCELPQSGLMPAMAARFAIHANAATERATDRGNRLDVHSLGLDGIVSDWPLVRMALLDTADHIEQHPEHACKLGFVPQPSHSVFLRILQPERPDIHHS